MKIRLKYESTWTEVNGEYFDEEGKFAGFLAGDPAAPGGEVIYPKEDVAEAPDWDAYRMEAAKDILCAMLAGDQIGDGKYYHTFEKIAQGAVVCADELIAKLQEK